jgi:putative flippase GtrA
VTKPSAGGLARAPLVSRQLVGFVVVGGISAAANFGSGAVVRLVSIGPIGYAVSVAVGFTAGTVVSFLLNRRYTFQVSDQPIGPQAVRFGIAALSGIALAWVFAEGLFWMLRALAPSLGRGRVESLAHIGAIGLNTLYTFTAMKFFALRRAAQR